MKALQLTEQLYSYILDHNPLPHPILAELRAETERMPNAIMQIAPDQGAFMNLLAKVIGAKRALEVGCYTGYSAIAVAAALPADGKLVTLDVNPETAAVAKRYFGASGLGGRIDLRLAPALDTLPQLEREYGRDSFDMMFIDADKMNIPNYFEWGLKLVRRGGLILVDNAFWAGGVIDPADQCPEVVAIRKFNAQIQRDERVDTALLNIADGIWLCRRR